MKSTRTVRNQSKTGERLVLPPGFGLRAVLRRFSAQRVASLAPCWFQSGITIDGRGAWLIGSAAGAPTNFTGTAILADGVSRVTLKNLNAKGWETGLVLRNAGAWVVENCNFSDNFHDPGFGWGEHGRRGGIVLENVRKSVLKNNQAHRVWDACVLDNDCTHGGDGIFVRVLNSWCSTGNWPGAMFM